MKANPEIILASSSPRRQQLLAMIGWQIQVHVPNIHEEKQAQETILEYIQRNAKEKAEAVAQDVDTTLPILAADTIVLFKDQLLEKPKDKDHAIRMLSDLSDETHIVWTAYHFLYCVDNQTKHCHGMVESRVSFRKLHPEEIYSYVATGSPMDKSGSYGIQDDIGAGFVRSIQGSYTNIVGLPLSEVIESLRSLTK